ncbi:transcriptional repressor [Clostridium drakei]|uniref:FUR family transcriptional regulator n=2 Tax=Clostridium TaxID=1485 RepID=A0A0E3JYP1_CLOSL|nr:MULTISPECIES: transcriptional repressor [Clostridium]AKA67602.1 FUR family transcriptional regulator [Clostridium scatologenes]AWI05976.1 transcriptional repressor [Clostridium drakei]
MEKDLIYLKKIIEDNGYMFTRQKEYILKTLIKSNIHLSAEEICKDVKKYSIGIATVYRSLKVFSKLNIIKEININGTNYYEMKMFSGKPLHIHFKCVKCNSIIDIDNKFLELDYLKLNSKIEKENNLIVSDADIMLIGLCNKCREDKNAKTN